MSAEFQTGVIPVGGEGRRLKAFIRNKVKVLIEVDGVEILTYPLMSLIQVGCKKIFLISSDYTHDEIQCFIRGKFSDLYSSLTKNINIEIINARAKGTAKALYHLKRYINEPFYYTNCNIVFFPSLLFNLSNIHSKGNFIATVGCSKEAIAPTHPHFLCSSDCFLTSAEIYPDISSPSLCSLETGIFEPEIFDYLKKLYNTAMVMEALNLIIKSNFKAKVFMYNNYWYHLAEPKDLELWKSHSDKLGKVRNILGIK